MREWPKRFMFAFEINAFIVSVVELMTFSVAITRMHKLGSIDLINQYQ